MKPKPKKPADLIERREAIRIVQSEERLDAVLEIDSHHAKRTRSDIIARLRALPGRTR